VRKKSQLYNENAIKRASDLYDEVVAAPIKDGSGLLSPKSPPPAKFVKLSPQQLQKKRIRIRLDREINAKTDQLMKCLQPEAPETGGENIFEKLNTGTEVPEETSQYLHEMLIGVH